MAPEREKEEEDCSSSTRVLRGCKNPLAIGREKRRSSKAGRSLHQKVMELSKQARRAANMTFKKKVYNYRGRRNTTDWLLAGPAPATNTKVEEIGVAKAIARLVLLPSPKRTGNVAGWRFVV